MRRMTQTSAPIPPTISIRSAAVLSGLSLRTWQRRIQDGQVAHLGGNGVGTLVPLQAVADLLPGAWAPHEVSALLAADAGDALAQAEVGAQCAQQVLPPALADADDERANAARRMAWHFLAEAAEQGQADAMHWLGLLHAAQGQGGRGDGEEATRGAEREEQLAIMWVARAATQGHVIAQRQIEGLLPRGRAKARGG